MKMEVIFEGFPGKTAKGSLSWSSVVYIESGKNKILFDTGGPSKRRSIREHLQKVGVEATDITMLILSHFHDDHVRNYDYFPNAEIIMHCVENEWALTGPVDDFAFPQPYYSAVKETGRLTLLRKESEEIAPGVETLLVPGHTPGGIAVILRDPQMPVTVMTGDAVKNLGELASGKVPGAHDEAACSRSIKKIRDIAEIVIPGHDRILRVTQDEIIAMTEARETIIVPAGVAGSETRMLELFLEKTRCKKEEIILGREVK
jgi:glyoxylase-like metal-dependent hydrolase (beta-lactamase superfamily II)